jgi:hypothetical protein
VAGPVAEGAVAVEPVAGCELVLGLAAEGAEAEPVPVATGPVAWFAVAAEPVAVGDAPPIVPPADLLVAAAPALVEARD